MSDTGAEGAAEISLDPEDRARANLYGVIGRLFYAPADPNMLAEISRGEQGSEGQDHGSGLVAAWRGVQEACRNAYPAVVRQEFDSLFIGVGKAQVSPYLSGYAEPMAPDRFLVRLRDQLAAFGLGRREKVLQTIVCNFCKVDLFLLAG